MKEEQLNEKIFDVAEELNQVLGLDPEIQTENVTVADVKQKVTEAAELIDPENDEFSKTTTKVLQAMGLTADDSAHNEDALESTNAQPEAESEEAGNDKEEEEPEESLVDQVNAAKKRKQLKQIVSDNPEVFANVKAEMKNLKDASSLKEAMLEVLEGSSEIGAPEPKTEQEDEEQSQPESKKKEEKTKNKSTQNQSSKSGGTKKSSKPGVISTIVSLVESSKKGITKQEILEELTKKFPDKQEKSMKNTVNVQVPNRIAKERFEIEKLEGGKYRKKQ